MLLNLWNTLNLLSLAVMLQKSGKHSLWTEYTCAAANAPSCSTISDILRKDQNFTSKILSVYPEELLSGSSTKKLANLSSKYWSNTWNILEDLIEFLPRATKWTKQLARVSCDLLDSNCRSNYQCSGGSLQSSHQKNIRFDCKGIYNRRRQISSASHIYMYDLATTYQIVQ